MNTAVALAGTTDSSSPQTIKTCRSVLLSAADRLEKRTPNKCFPALEPKVSLKKLLATKTAPTALAILDQEFIRRDYVPDGTIGGLMKMLELSAGDIRLLLTRHEGRESITGDVMAKRLRKFVTEKM